ncbi:unnamed protein product, partial [Chrysoparadoxa australica]
RHNSLQQAVIALCDVVAQSNATLSFLTMSQVELALSQFRSESAVDISGLHLSESLDIPVICALLAKNKALTKFTLRSCGLCGLARDGRGR